jgi:hypothetical protein
MISLYYKQKLNFHFLLFLYRNLYNDFERNEYYLISLVHSNFTFITYSQFNPNGLEKELAWNREMMTLFLSAYCLCLLFHIYSNINLKSRYNIVEYL